MISGIVGVLWTAWGASGLSGAESGAIRVAGIAAGVVIVVCSARMLRSDPRATRSVSSARRTERPGSMFSSSRYLIVVVLEVVAIGGGNQVLAATGHSEYAIAWVATVIGIHFLAFGRLFYAGFYWLGAAMVAAGVAGSVVGFAGGDPDAIKATSGLIAATSLFAAGGSTILRARADTHA